MTDKMTIKLFFRDLTSFRYCKIRGVHHSKVVSVRNVVAVENIRIAEVGLLCLFLNNFYASFVFTAQVIFLNLCSHLSNIG